MKECKSCHTNLPLSEFYSHSGMSDGHLNKCKKCVRARVIEHRENNIDRIRAFDRKRKSRSHKVDGAKHRVNNLVCNAVRDGRMTRQPCVICGQKDAEAHHQDYSKPYDVIWLCGVHHKRLHHRKFSLLPR